MLRSPHGAARALRLAIPIALFFGAFRPAAATTWHVLADGSGDAPTIQAALDLAVRGDTVLAGPGTFDESLAVSKSVVLRSEQGASSTTLNADGARFGVVVTAPEPALIEGFTITGVAAGGFELSRTIDVDGAAVFRDCVVTGNFALVAGAHLEDGDLRLFDTMFFGNFGTSAGQVGGLSCRGGYLVVQGCTFERPPVGRTIQLEGGTVELRGNVFRGIDSIDVREGTLSVLVFANLFDEVSLPITVQGATFLHVIGNSFVRPGSSGTALGPALGPNPVIEQNVFSGGFRGLWLCSTCQGATVRCNDSWGNTENWVGVADSDTNGNFSAAPHFCDPSGGDFTVAANSPLRNPPPSCGALIGAFDQGCSAMGVDPGSWGSVKSRYRP